MMIKTRPYVGIFIFFSIHGHGGHSACIHILLARQSCNRASTSRHDHRQKHVRKSVWWPMPPDTRAADLWLTGRQLTMLYVYNFLYTCFFHRSSTIYTNNASCIHSTIISHYNIFFSCNSVYIYIRHLGLFVWLTHLSINQMKTLEIGSLVAPCGIDNCY